MRERDTQLRNYENYETNREGGAMRDRQTERQTGRETDRQVERQTDRETDR